MSTGLYFNRMLIVLVFVFLSAVAHAQSIIEEIVVTATKRVKTLQDVPVAVSVATGETIERSGVQNISGLQTLVPTLRVTQLQSVRNTSFAIRGFSNGVNNVGLEPSVGIFIDGVYRSRAGAIISDLPRLERIEVLNGPQSTLFGKNASAGVVSVITPKPSGETGGYISGSISNFNGSNFKGMYESSITKNLSFDISGNLNQRDGYFDNRLNNGQLNDRNRWGVRSQLFWTPNDTMSIRIIADYDEIDEVCCGATNVQTGQTADAIALLGGQIVPNSPFSRAGYFETEPFNKLENSGVSGHIDIDYGKLILTSISSFRSSEADENVDIDFSSLSITDSGKNSVLIDTFTQELRLTSSGSDGLDWMIGGFYFDENIDYASEVIWGADARPYIDTLTGGALAGIEASAGLPIGQTFFRNGNGVREVITQGNQALSLFSTIEWQVHDALIATLGINYTEDKKEVFIEQINTAAFSQFPGAVLDSIGANTLRGLQTFQQTLSLPNSVESNRSDDGDLTYSLRLAYDLADNVNAYVNHSTGFKASSWNLSRDSRPSLADFGAIAATGLTTPNLSAGTRFSAPEEASVFELGLKAKYERLAFNAAIFQQSIKDFQSAIFIGTGFVLSNAGEQTTTGMEFDLNYHPTNSLNLTLAGTFLDAKYDSFVGAEGPTGPTDLSGEKVAGVHEFSFVASATYDFQLGDNKAYIRGDYQYEDSVQSNENVSADIATREVKLFNLAAGLSIESGFDFNVWVRNVTDEDFLFAAFPTPLQAGSFNGYPNEPRIYGISVKKTF